MGDIAELFAPGGWEFTSEVVAVFDDHVRASVPHYDLMQQMVADLSDWLLPAGATYVDLGASTGTTAELLLRRHPDRRVTVWLYDEQAEMLERAARKLAPVLHSDTQLHLCVQRVEDPHAHWGADLTTALFTLQFLSPADRDLTLNRARQHSAPHGTLIVAEKIRPADSRWAEIAIDSSHDWKAQHGIDPAAIQAKARALRGVLRPRTEHELHTEIADAGWRDPETLFRWHNWTVVAAYAAGGHDNAT